MSPFPHRNVLESIQQRATDMAEYEGFFPKEDSRNPREAEMRALKREGARLARVKREWLKTTFMTRNSLSGPVTKSLWDWKKHDKK
jgi:hypothetical protein